MSTGYERISNRQIYVNPWVALEVHKIRHPNGTPGEHVLVVTPQACAVIVVDEDDLLFARQPRFGAQAEVLELVKGGADAGESALGAAQREAREELGVVAEKWEHIGEMLEIPSIISQGVQIFVASEIYHVDVALEPQETVELVRVPKKNAFAAVASGEISDAVTAGALLRYGLLSGSLRWSG
jgi:8-oxo-dGTP pyrophosphatase MutT (NUDIX family)